ncbi:MAG: RelA/SpoT domain-containing protein [Candidatus Nomurabacteria bacterium]|jgi:hypothetical protein|nr:RelA/SpoT domain-containing protein [Candidatus Nomurabacteria bacterium]
MSQIRADYSKNQINNAGLVIAKNYGDIKALRLINSWREIHIESMDVVFSNIKVLAPNTNTIIAERLKRLSTIVDKVQRFPTMRLSSMQDIAGVRIILPDITDIQRFIKKATKPTADYKPVKLPTNYIADPKSDGYRGVHVVYKFTDSGLFVELQIRSHLQHVWATAIESMGIYLDQPFKNGGGDGQWREFFALVSSAFAYFESSDPIKRHKKIGLAGIYKKIEKLNGEIDAVAHIQSFAKMGETLNTSIQTARKLSKMVTPKKSKYALMSLDLQKKEVKVKLFSKNKSQRVMQAYKKMEKRSSRYDQVLVSVSKMSELAEAYPNYFLDLQQFSVMVVTMLEEYGKSVV